MDDHLTVVLPNGFGFGLAEVLSQVATVRHAPGAADADLVPLLGEADANRALKDHTIAGAAIDVWYRYPAADEACPPVTEPFHELDNIIMTPYVAGWTNGTARYRWAEIADNLRRLRTGEPLLNVVKPAISPRG